MMNKNNVPYYIAGTLAAFTLLASGVFAAAPYAQFLAPVATLSVGLPFIIGVAVLSVITIALSYKAISKDKTISEKEAQLAKKAEEITDKDKTISKKEAVIRNQKQTISEKEKEIKDKDTQLADEKSKVETKDTIISEKKALVQAQKQTISERDDQLAGKSTEISNLRNQLDEEKAKGKEISKKESEGGEIVEDSSASRLAKAAVAGAMATGGVAGEVLVGIAGGMAGCTLGPVMLRLYVAKSIILTTKKEDEVYELAKGILDSVGSGVNKVYNAVPSIESVKGTFSGIGGGLKNTCDASITSVRGALNSVGSSLYSRLYGTKVSILEEQFKREDGSKPSMQELTPLGYLDLAVSSSEQKQRANSLDYLNIDNDVPKQPDHLSIDAAKRYLMSLSEDQDVFYDAESGDEKDTKISSLKEQLDENSKTKIQSRISDLCESVKGKFTSFWSGVQSIYSKNVYNSCALGTDLLHAQHTSTLANVPQEEVINKEAQKPEEQADQKPNLQRDNNINNTEEGGKNKRSGAARRKRKQAQVEQPIVYAVRTSNKYDLLSPEYFLG